MASVRAPLAALALGLCLAAAAPAQPTTAPPPGADRGRDLPDQDLPDADQPDADLPDRDLPDPNQPDGDLPDHDLTDQDLPSGPQR